MLTNIDWCERYISRIKNNGKKAYARAYLNFKSNHADMPNHHSFGIGGMAAQAVRQNIDHATLTVITSRR
jgi:hypothetical protein